MTTPSTTETLSNMETRRKQIIFSTLSPKPRALGSGPRGPLPGTTYAKAKKENGSRSSFNRQ